jgi:hypothetical protein
VSPAALIHECNIVALTIIKFGDARGRWGRIDAAGGNDDYFAGLRSPVTLLLVVPEPVVPQLVWMKLTTSATS